MAYRDHRLPTAARLSLGLLLLLTAALPPSAAAKKAKRPTAEQAIEALFAAKEEPIRDCALTNAVYKGAKRVDVNAKMLVGRDGRVFGVTLSVTLDAGDKTAVEGCISEVLRQMTFPKGDSALRELLRTWRFATQ